MHFPISLTHGAPRAFGAELRYNNSKLKDKNLLEASLLIRN